MTLRDLLKEIASFDSLDEPVTIRLRIVVDEPFDVLGTEDLKAVGCVGNTLYEGQGLLIWVDRPATTGTRRGASTNAVSAPIKNKDQGATE